MFECIEINDAGPLKEYALNYPRSASDVIKEASKSWKLRTYDFIPIMRLVHYFKPWSLVKVLRQERFRRNTFALTTDYLMNNFMKIKDLTETHVNDDLILEKNDLINYSFLDRNYFEGDWNDSVYFVKDLFDDMREVSEPVMRHFKGLLISNRNRDPFWQSSSLKSSFSIILGYMKKLKATVDNTSRYRDYTNIKVTPGSMESMENIFLWREAQKEWDLVEKNK